MNFTRGITVINDAHIEVRKIRLINLSPFFSSDRAKINKLSFKFLCPKISNYNWAVFIARFKKWKKVSIISF